MVDQRQLGHAALRNEEYQSINQALHMIDEGAKIVAMMIGTPNPTETRQPTGLMVRTDHMTYPQPMVAGITQQLMARRDAIREELRGMGVVIPDKPPSPARAP